jgi:predicted permease
MSPYNNVIHVGGAIILMIALGFLLSKLKVIDPKVFDPMNRFVFRCCFIGLILKIVIHQRLETMDFTPLVILVCSMFTANLLLALTTLYPVPDRFQTFLETMLPSTYVNYMITGFPIFNAIWGEENNVTATIITLSNDLMTVPLYYFLCGVHKFVLKNREHRAKGEELEKFSLRIFRDIALNILLSPIIIGYIIGFIWAGFHIPVPLFMNEVIRVLSDVVVPLSCLCIGGFLAQHSLISCHWAQFAIGLVVRHILCPIIAGVFAKLMNGGATMARQCMIMSALPSAVASYLLSSNQGIGTGMASTMVFWTNIVFLPVIIVWFLTLDGLRLFVEED